VERWKGINKIEKPKPRLLSTSTESILSSVSCWSTLQSHHGKVEEADRKHSWKNVIFHNFTQAGYRK